MNEEVVGMVMTFRRFLNEGYEQQVITKDFFLQGLLLTSLYMEDEIILH